jgi:hypothetical protein
MAKQKSLDIKRETIEEPEPIDKTIVPEKIKTPFDWKGASITLALLIIAIWSAYFVTMLLSDSSDAKLPNISNITSQIFHKDNSTPTTTTAPSTTDKITKETPPDLPTKTTETPATASDTNPFAPLGTDTKTSSTETKEIDKQSFSIRILNGNGVAGEAAVLKKDLEGKGFKVGTIGNAQAKYETTLVYYLSDKKKEAELVQSNLTGRTVELKESKASLIGKDYQILVVMGKK